jgi:AcrR family transcriptional regulator
MEIIGQIASHVKPDFLYSVKNNASRAQRVKASVAAFLEAGITSIAECGIDQVTVSGVNALTKLTRPTFYSLFGNLEGLFADIWVNEGQWFLDNLADPKFRLEISSPETQAKMRALLEIFTVSHRLSEVAEVVEPMARNWWQKNTGGDEYAQLKLSWLTGQRIGSWLTYPIEPKALLAGFVGSVIQGLGDRPQTRALSRRQAKLPELQDPKFADQSMENQLLDAAIRVISRVGVVNASMSRISRYARVSTGALYPRFKNHDELVLASFTRAISAIVEENFAQVQPEGFTPENFGLITSAGLLDGRKVWRNYRVEMHLTARVNNRLAESIRTALTLTNERVSSELGLLPISKTEREAVAFLVHTIGIGLAVLLNTSIRVDALDHRLLTRDMVQELAKR